MSFDDASSRKSRRRFLALPAELPIALPPIPSNAGVLDLARRLRLSP